MARAALAVDATTTKSANAVEIGGGAKTLYVQNTGANVLHIFPVHGKYNTVEQEGGPVVVPADETYYPVDHDVVGGITGFHHQSVGGDTTFDWYVWPTAINKA